jgi:hypothetical protein
MEPKFRVEKFMARATSENVFGEESLARNLLLTALFYTYLSPPASMFYVWPIQDLRDHQITGLPNECSFCQSVYNQSQQEI